MILIKPSSLPLSIISSIRTVHRCILRGVPASALMQSGTCCISRITSLFTPLSAACLICAVLYILTVSGLEVCLVGWVDQLHPIPTLPYNTTTCTNTTTTIHTLACSVQTDNTIQDCHVNQHDHTTLPPVQTRPLILTLLPIP